MYDNIFSAELVLVLLHDLLIKSGKLCWQFWSPRRLNWKIYVQRVTTRLIRGMKSLFSGKEWEKTQMDEHNEAWDDTKY